MTTPRAEPHAAEDRSQKPRPPQTPASPQADGNSEPVRNTQRQPARSPESADEHIGATEDEVSDTSAPAGADFQDEPKQG